MDVLFWQNIPSTSIENSQTLAFKTNSYPPLFKLITNNPLIDQDLSATMKTGTGESAFQLNLWESIRERGLFKPRTPRGERWMAPATEVQGTAHVCWTLKIVWVE